ncbi:spectrin repeat-containing domain protein [Oesophagostomum dentatum]|uniref:Spectrin repeat-containing domain protein n=1 Tax=Oesophagostomum dentatum TaxID=61180 RepID=A0A0B1TJA0_OESDE|nr:spectrin repeat-containing domain protein [Oesophagostomum dentatum]
MTHQTRTIASVRERSADPSYFAEARREAKALLEEVAREESSLKAIGALLAKIEQEVDSLYESVPETSTRGIHSTEIRNTFYRVEDDFSTLQKQCGDLIQFQNRIGSLGTDLNEHLRKVDDWFANMESKVTEVDKAPDMDVEHKLAVLEDLNQQVVDGHKQFDQVDQASRRLLSALDGMNAHPDVSSRHEMQAIERKKRYRHDNLLSRIQEAFNHATAQKAANEGVRDAVLDLYPWIDEYEGRAKTSRDIPLVEEPLNELKREVQLLRMELDSRLALTKDLESDLRKLSASSPPQWKQDVEEKLEGAVARLQKNSTELRGFRDNVNDALEGVVKLESTGASLNRACDAVSSMMKATNARDLPRLQEVAGEIDSMNAQIADMRRTAEVIKQIPNATGAEAVDAYVSAIGKKVSGLNDELQAKHSQQAQVGHLENEFEDVKKRLNDWLGQFEADTVALEPVSINREKLVEQRKQLSALMTRHKEGLALVEELDSVAIKLGNAEESAAPGNRLSAIPRVAMDLLTRYNAQADALKTRAEKVDRAEHKAVDLIAAEEELHLWIAAQNKNMGDFEVPTTAESVQSLQTSLDRLNKSKRAEQRRLDDIRIRGRELAGEASLPGEAQQVLDRSRVLSDEWDQLTDNLDAMRERLGKLEKWVDGYAATEKWVLAKRRMLAAVGVPTTDAAIAGTQLGQIQIIKAEMDGERSSLSKLNDVAQKLSSELADNTLTLAMADLNASWNNLEKDVDEREQNIQLASKLGAEIKAVQKDLLKSLADVESDIDRYGNMLPSEVEAKLNVEAHSTFKYIALLTARSSSRN